MAAQLVSYVGDGMRAAALPLLALSVTNDSRLIAGVTVAAGLPTWLALVAGVWVDRTPPRTAFVSSAAISALAVSSIAVALAIGHPSLLHIYSVSFVLSAGEIVYAAASQRWLTQGVPQPQLRRANSLLVGVQVVGTELAGPLLGAALVAVSVVSVFVLDTVSFVWAAMLYISLRRSPSDERSPRRSGSGRRPLTDIAEALRFVHDEPLLWRLALTVMALVTAQTMLVSVLVLYVARSGFAGGRTLGLFLAAGAIGGLAGSATASPICNRLNVVAALRLSITTVALSLVAFAAATSLAVALVAAALNGLASAWWSINSATARQEMTPEALAGRVSTVHRFIGRSTYPVAALGGGVIAEAIGVRGALVVAGAVALAAHVGLLGLARPDQRATG